MIRFRPVALLAVAIAGALLSGRPVSAQLPTPTYGWNLGNTLEPPGGEGTWGPRATEALIDAVAKAGFNTVRIPCAWDSNANQTTRIINPVFMARVKQVVDWCYARNLHVIINCHWDNGWLENKITDSVNPTIDAKQNAYWTQIATAFRDYDHRLLFAGANEPNADTAAEVATLLAYHQTFVNAVRATGGNNTTRWLVVQGPNTNIDLTSDLMRTLPTDPTPGRLAIEVHFYDPYQFTLMNEDASWGKMAYFWGAGHEHATRLDRNSSWGEEAHVDEQFKKMQTTFVDRGIPVILGEFAAQKRKVASDLAGADYELHLAARAYFHGYVMRSAQRHGLKPFFWDIAGVTFDWTTGAIVDAATEAALTEGAAALAYTGEKQAFFRTGAIAFTPQFQGAPTEFAATGLPEGLALDPATGRISGTVTTPTEATVTVTAKAGTTTVSQEVKFAITPSTFTESRLVNISLRATTTPGEKTAIAGLTVTGEKVLLARLAGPALVPHGVQGTLEQPRLKLYRGATLLATWGALKDSADPAGVSQAASYAGAFAFAPGSSDAGVVVPLTAGQYTLQATGLNDATGAGLIELYDLDRGSGRFSNLSMRAEVGTGSGVMITGVVVEGPTARTFLIRAVGPTLKPYGITAPLADPKLTVYDQNTRAVLATNDNWGQGGDADAVATAAGRLGAFELARDSMDAAVLVTLSTGLYSVVVEGADGGTGVALAELYDVSN